MSSESQSPVCYAPLENTIGLPVARMASEISAPKTVADEESREPQTSSLRSLAQAVHARRAEFTRPQKIRVKVGTWNVAACPGTDKDITSWFVDGKGVEERLSTLSVSNESGSQDNIESAGAQQERSSGQESTIPIGDTGVIAGGDDIDLYVLGLQEIVELSSAKEYLGKIYNDATDTIKWRNEVLEGLPKGYELVAEQQLSGLLLLIFASPKVAPTITSVSTVGVGTGIMGYLGNKGAVSTRLLLGDTTRLVFVNSHLASGADPAHLERRCWDVSQILSRTRFDPIVRSGVVDDAHEVIGDEDFAFWFGDLNFRLEGLPGEDIRRLLMLHTRGEYDPGQLSLNKIDSELAEGPIIVGHPDNDDDDESILSTPRTFQTILSDSSGTTLPDPDEFVHDPHQDPSSLQATIDSLLPHDQLARVKKAGKAFQDGWREGPINFLPTYKYDVGSVGLFDSSEKQRPPSWCDRILFRTRRDKLAYDGELQERELALIKDEELKARGIDHAADDDDVLFDYDPEADGADDSADYDEYTDDTQQPDEVVTKDGFIDRIHLETYISHQRVLSSDHKPLDAVFTLEYDAVVPELKAQVQQEVARDLDRAENEGRPGVTVIADNSPSAGEVKLANSENRISTDSVEGVDFGEVSYSRRKARHLTVANTSQGPASFTFVETTKFSGEESIAPSWLNVYFVGIQTGQNSIAESKLDDNLSLEPGDSVDVVLEFFIDDIELVRELNNGTAQLDDVLVLRVVSGRDHFIPVHASWLPSCFGYSVQELIRVPEGGVRSFVQSSDRPKNIKDSEIRCAAPREIFKVTEAVEHLVERVAAEWQMSEIPLPRDAIIGWPFDPASWLLKDPKTREHQGQYVLEALDTGWSLIDAFPSDVPPVERLELIAETTINFLKHLKDGIIPEELTTKIENEMLAQEKAKKSLDDEEQRTLILDILSTSPNYNISFVFLTSMLSRISSEIIGLVVSPVTSSSASPKLNRSRTHNGSSSGSSSASIRSSLSLRRSLTFKSSPASIGDFVPIELGDGIDENAEREKARAKVHRRLADIFAPVMVRGHGTKKGWEDRRRNWVELFLRGNER